MRRTPRARAVALAVGVLLVTPVLAVAEPDPNTVGDLVAGVANANATTAITAAHKRFDTFAAATYVNGPSESYLTAADPGDMLNTAAAGQLLSSSSQQIPSSQARRGDVSVKVSPVRTSGMTPYVIRYIEY